MYKKHKSYLLEVIEMNCSYKVALSIFATELFLQDYESELYEYIDREDEKYILKAGF